MTAHFNIDEVVKHVKTIADNNRCGICDKLSGDRLRYSCGHSICGECVTVADECLTCNNTTKTKPALDLVQGQLVKNVSNLLTTFQEAFNIDVYRRYRLSEKLKIENQLFPECIQASVKYYNKRRSSNIRTTDDKENFVSSFFAGEGLNNSHSTTMNTRINLVQKWLEKNEKVERPVRKPFSDINVNNSIRSNKDNKFNKGLQLQNQENDLKKKSKTRNKEKNKATNKKKSKNVLSPSLLNYYKNETIQNKSKPENRISFDKKYDKSSKVTTDCNNYEINSDVEPIDTIVIEDTQTQVDKDKDAWLKVVEEHNESMYNIKDNQKSLEQKPLSETQDELKADRITMKKNVPYYKKAYLFKSCYYCLKNNGGSIIDNQRLNSNNVSITINTKSISSTITVLREDEDYNDKVITKHSIQTQTDDYIIGVEPKHLSPSNENISSPDIFVDDVKKQADIDKENINNKDIGISDNYNSRRVINDSDSDDMDCSGPIKVSVDVHRSNDMDGILSTVDSADYQSRVRRSARRPTVDSSNSSEKENLEPNRIKRRKLGKKQVLKK
ncbi:reticulocyte-binding protein homolog 2b [Papilio machaon]|uniref:reticulocyte-binding protein homolog 2b n=1 Tax=Papilio machaon TaxID=76193 RepID=UPI001E665067|nr:reticulocyte-binding protein homolog 2b [Papilio machaon]XP_014356859.2 reticulocyte-binding protein homolog 2b [Papilio machaon]